MNAARGRSALQTPTTHPGFISAEGSTGSPRSTRDLLNILHALTEKGAKFKSLHDPWADPQLVECGDRKSPSW